ncbi:Lysosomal thioesterase ppt2, partial [Globisporangium splendens]
MTRSVPLLVILLVAISSCVVSGAIQTNQQQLNGSKLPIFYFHGLAGAATQAENLRANLTAEGRVFHALTFCENECSLKPLREQVQLAITQISAIVSQDNVTFTDGYMFVGLSQGALLARAVIEEWDSHNVKAFISLAGPHNGLFYGPQPTDFTCLDIMATIYGPQVIDASLFNFSTYTPADYSGKLQHDLNELVLKPELQNQYAVFDLLYSPVRKLWLEGNPFLATTTNINTCTGADKDCAPAQQRRRANFLKLRVAHFFGSPQDDFIAPWQSSILGHYSDVSTTEQIETSFSSFKVLTMQQTTEFKQDTYGLKTLAARGGIFLHEAPNVGHSCWIRDYTTFDGKLDCKFQPVYDQYVYPVLRDPFCS